MGVVGRSGPEFSVPTPYHDANNGAPNLLLRNNGKLSFQDVTREVGLQQNNTRFSFAASWEDFDNDGDLDICVATGAAGANLIWAVQDNRTRTRKRKLLIIFSGDLKGSVKVKRYCLLRAHVIRHFLE